MLVRIEIEENIIVFNKDNVLEIKVEKRNTSKTNVQLLVNLICAGGYIITAYKTESFPDTKEENAKFRSKVYGLIDNIIAICNNPTLTYHSGLYTDAFKLEVK